jgi:hypothetical protein
MKYNISEEINNKCIKFAEDSVNSSADHYAKRNQNNIEKIKKDIRVGKIAEQIVYEHFVKEYKTLSAPDYNIYNKGQKSWETDLKDSNNLKIAVKGQDIMSNIHFGESWIFQKGDGIKDCDKEIFKEKNNNYVAFVSLNIPKRIAEIRAVVKVSWLHDNDLFKETQQEYLKSNKVAVYYSDLEKFKEIYQL